MNKDTQTPILTLTLNPALDMSTLVPKLVPDQKLRCTEPLLDPGGGGLNVSRAIAGLGVESLALVALGGLTGDRLAGLIRAEGVPFLALTAPGETRQSLTVTAQDTGQQYLFMLPGPVWSDADQDRVFMLLRASARAGAIGGVSGSQPPGGPGGFPARPARGRPGRGGGGSVMVDAYSRIFAKAAKVKVKSKVGAGDSFVAGFVLALARGQDSAHALALGAAAASAAVMTDATQLCRVEDVMRLLPECVVTEV